MRAEQDSNGERDGQGGRGFPQALSRWGWAERRLRSLRGRHTSGSFLPPTPGFYSSSQLLEKPSLPSSSILGESPQHPNSAL